MLRAIGTGLLACCALGACASEAGGPAAAPLPSWSVAWLDVQPATLGELIDIITKPPDESDTVDANVETSVEIVDIGELSAAVFAVNSADPDVDHRDWHELMDHLCGPEQLVAIAIANDWTIQVTGFVDKSGPRGPGTANERLPLERAQAAAAAISSACVVPGENPEERARRDFAIETLAGGTADDNIRKVVVAIRRTTTQEAPQS